MEQLYDPHNNLLPASALIAAESERLARYLTPDLLDALNEAGTATAQSSMLLEVFVHLAAARYTITTYLPRLLAHQLLDQRLTSPWLQWVDGSLLFADLSGSTALAERLSALGREGTEMVTDFLNEIFAIMIQVIQEHDGDLVSFGGDALLVFFGGPRHSHTAVRAALALQDALHGYVKSVPNIGSFPMHLHVGVESGRVAFVSAGSRDAAHYSVMGATVNGVAAAEGRAEPGEVVVGPVAVSQLGEELVGDLVAPGFIRATALQATTMPRTKLAEPALVIGLPNQAIPQLLDDLDLLSAYIPDVLLGRIIADPQRPQVEADLRPVTVIFVQVVGLELVAEALEPALAAQVAQQYVSTMQEAVEQYGGMVNKLDVADEGVKLVAVFGAPTAYEDHTERAARAALRMRDRLDTVNRTIDALLAPTGHTFIRLQQRIGINLGTAFAGNVGSPARKEYTVMGDAVNVAARVMSKAAWGEVWCSEATVRQIETRVSSEDRGQMMVKGKAAPLALFQLREERETQATLVSDEGPLIGRDDDLTWLYQHLHAAVAGNGRAVRLVGEAGVGKSRLAAAVVEAALAHGMRFLPAASFSYTASIPYAAWGEWLKSLCGIVAGDNDAVRARKLTERLLELGLGMDEWLPLLGDLVRLDVPENRLTRGLDPQTRQTRRFELLEQLLLRAAEQEPLIILFEDLHWADPISLDLWKRVTGAIEGHPIMMLGVHRASAALDELDDQAQVLALKELSLQESATLVNVLAGEVDLPEPLLRQLVARSSGNPLFLAELLRAILQRLELPEWRSMAGENAGAALAPISSVLEELPDSLNGLLLSRIDRLDEISRTVLRVASVIGQRIPFGVLQSLQPADQKTLTRQLTRLDSEELTVLERIEPERVHAFRHALIQEVAYQSMLYARRRELHGRIGEYLERRYGDDLDDYYGLLAHHYRLSDRREKAITYLIKAGDAARDNYANEEAIQAYCWALEALDDESDPRAWETRDALGDVYEATGQYEHALTQHALIISAPGVTADIARRAHRKRGSAHEKQGQYALALEELDRAMTIALSGAPNISPLAIPRTCADIALVRQRLGEYDLAIAACEQGLRALRHDHRTRYDEMIEADLHSILGGIYGMRGDYPRSQHHFERCLRARETIDDLAGVSSSHSNLGYLWQLQSEYELALDHYRIAEQHARKLNRPYVLIIVHTNAADALISLGRYSEAEARCRESLEIAKRLNTQHTTAQIYNTLGIIFFHQGKYGEALAAYNEAQQLNQALGSTYEESSALINIALTLGALGRLTEADQAAQQGVERADALQSQRLKAEALNVLAEIALGRGDDAAAAEAAGAAHELAIQIGSKHDEGVARRLLGRAAAIQGQPFEALFEESITLLETIKHRFELARTWAEYGLALIAARNQSKGHTYLKQAREAFIAVGADGELQRIAPEFERRA